MTHTSRASSNPSTDNSHWTERTTEDFVYRITFDCVQQVEQSLASREETQAILAKKVGLTPGRVSQTLNNPASMSLKTIVKYARAIGKKVALVLYDDSDHANSSGPINSEIFRRCWERVGKPRNFFDLETAATAENIRYIVVSSLPITHSGWTYSRDYHRGMLSTQGEMGYRFLLAGGPPITSGEARPVTH